MQKVWFASDYHFDHANIMNTPLRKAKGYKNVHEMNNDIIEQHNSRVSKGDLVYYLGDFTLRATQERIGELGSKLNGNIIFIIGNHDNPGHIKRVFGQTYSLLNIKPSGHDITLCHFPMLSWNKSHYNSWMIHGHNHTDISSVVPGKRLNVAWEVIGFRPMELEEVESYMYSQPDNWDLIKEKEK